jgi:hypothetical protein
VNRTELRRLLDKHFGESELRDLSWDLEIEFDNLPAIAKKDKAREMIALLERTSRLRFQLEFGKIRKAAIDAILDELRHSRGPLAK